MSLDGGNFGDNDDNGQWSMAVGGDVDKAFSPSTCFKSSGPGKLILLEMISFETKRETQTNERQGQ